jgi:hypothetical protein
MSAMIKCWSLSVSVAGVLLASTVFAGDGRRDPCGCSQARGATLSFQTGDTLQVALSGAKLMLGSQLLATLPQGERIVVQETRGSWVGTRVSIGGQMKAGWIRTADFAPIDRVAGDSRAVGATYAANPQVAEPSEALPQPQAYGAGGSAVYEPQYGSSAGTYFGYPTNSHEVYGHYHP